jgi:hypothetical protein
MNSLWKILQLGFVGVRALCFIILITGIGLQFTPVQTFLINSFVLKKHQSIQLEGFKGLFPFYFSFDKMQLYDHNQPFLTIQKLSINWSIMNFVRHQIIAIQKLNMDQIEYCETPSSKKFDDFKGFPKIPLGYIANIKVTQALYKTPKKTFKYSIDGNTQHTPNGLEFKLQLINPVQKSNTLIAHIKYSYDTINQEPHIKLDLIAKEEKGLTNHLFPALKDKLHIKLNGEGTLNNFKGNLSAQLGEAKLISSLFSNEDSDKKHINIFSTHQYTVDHDTYLLSGKITTTKTLKNFDITNINLKINNVPYLNASGNIIRNTTNFFTKNLNVVILLSPNTEIHTLANFKFDPYNFIFEGNLTNDILLDSQKVLVMNIPISLQRTIESLRLTLDGKGNIPNLPLQYKQYSEFKITANLDNASVKERPIINFKLVNSAGKLQGNFVFAKQPELKIQGDILSNSFKVSSIVKNDTWHISGKNIAPAKQSWSLPKFVAIIKPLQKYLEFKGDFELKLDDKNINVEFNTYLDTQSQYITLNSLKVFHKESFLESKGGIDFLGKEGGFDWHLYTFNLGDLFGDTSISGTTSILGHLRINPTDSILTFSGEFHKIFLSNLAISSGIISGTTELNSNPNIHFSLVANKATAYNTIFENFSINTNGKLKDFSTTVAINGFSERALKGNFAFSVLNLSALELETINIQLGQHKILLSQPTRLSYIDEKITLNTINLSVDNGSIEFKGGLIRPTFELRISLNNVPSALFSHLTYGNYFLKGTVNGAIMAYGEIANPKLKANIKTSDSLYNTNTIIALNNGLLNVTTDVQNDKFKFYLNGNYPIALQIAPFEFGIDHLRTFRTTILMNGSLDNIHKIFDFNYDKLYGNVDANISLYGTIDNPTSKGYINITNGSYERQNIGLKLNNINLDFYAQHGQFILSKPTTFNDPEKNTGNILFAKLGISKDLIPYLNTEVNFKKIHFINLPQTRRGGMSALCSGILKIDGPINAFKVYARGEISSLEKYIGETEETPIYEVKVVHKNLPLNTNTIYQNNTPRPSSVYDIDLSLDRKFHIFGQGLDSTWKGRLIIQGTVNHPIYKGQFVLQEGQLRILDRFFDVQRGEIFFDGDLSPNLYIESDLQLQDMRVKIILEGDTTNLHKRLISDQNLSEQEILQKLFFNRSSTVSQSFQALNYLAASSFISSFINIGFYQQEDPITHVEREFISLKQKFSKKTYGKVDVALNNNDTDRVSIAAGIQPTAQTKTELTFSPDKNRIGIGIEWNLDF